MKKTQLQFNIEKMNNVKGEIDNFTIHANKQAFYNRMFKAQNYAKYEPTGKESKFELLVNFKVHIAITTHCLKNLEKKGNLNASELLRNINHTISMEDLQQEVLLKFVELEKDWNIDFFGNVTFLSDETMKQIFARISTHLYQFQVKHYKHLYIELDNSIVDCTKVSQLADYVSIDNILSDLYFKIFFDNQSEIDKKWLSLRLEGFSNLFISKELNVTYEKIRACEKRVRKNWEKYNN